MSRQKFTMLAEWVGQQEAVLISAFGVSRKGGFTIGSLINSLADALEGEREFKRDKFTRHARIEREMILELAKEARRSGGTDADPADPKVNRA